MTSQEHFIEKFKDWIKGDVGLIFALVNALVFLMTNYSGLLNEANPYAQGLLRPHPILATILFIQESFFFGSATIIVMIQARNIWIKFAFCFMEGLAVFFYLNKGYLDKWLNGYVLDGQFILTTFIAIFSFCALFLLGLILLERLKEEDKEKQVQSFALNIPYTYKFSSNGQARKEEKRLPKKKKSP